MNRNLILNPAFVFGAALAVALASPSGAQVVYQDNFDDQDLATNTGVGGGLTVAFARRGGWVEDIALEATGTRGSTNGSVHSTSGFDLANGFTLTVTYNTATVAAGEVNRVNIGLIDAAAFGVTSSDAESTRNPFSDNNDKYGIGLNLTPDLGDQGLVFADDAGTGSVTFLSNDQTIAAGTQTLVLEMDGSSNYSYSIDGAPATTGSVPGGFDYSRNFNFFASYQSFPHEVEIREVTLALSDEQPLELTNAPNATNPANYDFTIINTREGKVYDLVSNTGLDTPTSTWPVWEGNENVAGAMPEILLPDIPGGADPKRFFAVVEKDPPR